MNYKGIPLAMLRIGARINQCIVVSLSEHARV